MAATIKRIKMALTKADQEQLESLSKHFGENISGVMRRALILLHYLTFQTKDSHVNINEKD